MCHLPPGGSCGKPWGTCLTRGGRWGCAAARGERARLGGVPRVAGGANPAAVPGQVALGAAVGAVGGGDGEWANAMHLVVHDGGSAGQHPRHKGRGGREADGARQGPRGGATGVGRSPSEAISGGHLGPDVFRGHAQVPLVCSREFREQLGGVQGRVDTRHDETVATGSALGGGGIGVGGGMEGGAGPPVAVQGEVGDAPYLGG
jgi:hypothetical protein